MEIVLVCAASANGEFFFGFYLIFKIFVNLFIINLSSVRKNRETAILSQKRKREKIEEFDTLTEKYNSLMIQVFFYILKKYIMRILFN